MKRALFLLLVLTALAGAATGWVNAAKHDCRGMKHEFMLHAAAMDVCAQSLACRFEVADLVRLERQQLAVKQCEAAQ